MQLHDELPVGAANVFCTGARRQPEDFQRLLAGHGTPGVSTLAALPLHVLAPGRMQAVEISLHDLRRLGVGEAAILPEVCKLDGLQVLKPPADEEALEDATVHIARIVVEL